MGIQGRRIDLTGQQFNRLTVIGFSHTKAGAAYWHVHCACGNRKTVRGCEIKYSKTKSCGCLVKETINKREYKHGMYGTRTYITWAQMKARCLDKNHTAYKGYGGRGITVCDKWMNFEDFYKDMGERPKGKTIDRIDNDGNYERGNCKWSTPKEQANNRRKRGKKVTTYAKV